MTSHVSLTYNTARHWPPSQRTVTIHCHQYLCTNKSLPVAVKVSAHCHAGSASPLRWRWHLRQMTHQIVSVTRAQRCTTQALLHFIQIQQTLTFTLTLIAIVTHPSSTWALNVFPTVRSNRIPRMNEFFENCSKPVSLHANACVTHTLSVKVYNSRLAILHEL